MGIRDSLGQNLKVVHMMALFLGMYVSHELLHMKSLKILEKGSSSGYCVICVEQSIHAV